MVHIANHAIIADSELEFVFARSSGPGGQNVNKVETKVTLRFPVFESPSLSTEQKQMIAAKLATRINKEGILRVSSQRHRTRAANQKAVVERFVELLAEALEEDAIRKPTRVSKAIRQRRLDDKRRRSAAKRLRSVPSMED